MILWDKATKKSLIKVKRIILNIVFILLVFLLKMSEKKYNFNFARLLLLDLK